MVGGWPTEQQYYLQNLDAVHAGLYPDAVYILLMIIYNCVCAGDQ